MIHLFGPLPQLYRAGKFWSDEYVTGPPAHNGNLLAQRLDNEGVDSELIDFIMRMLHLDPEKRISARDALRHEWLVGPLLGYWAVLGVERKAADNQERGWQRPVDAAKREIVKSRTSTPEMRESPAVERKLPAVYDFSTMEDEDDNEEVSFVYAGSSPTKPLPSNEPRIPVEPEEQVLTLRDGANFRTMMKYYYCK
jgi:serine/threonine protein kinase